MFVANATFETRASFGVGDFAYSACSLSARSKLSDSTSILLSGLLKSAAHPRLKLRRSLDSHPALLAASSDAIDLAPELAVVSRRAHESALTASIPVSAFDLGALLSLRAVAKQGTAAVEEFSSLAPCRCEARHYFSGGIFLPVAKQGTAAVEEFSSLAPCRGEARRYLSGGIFLPVASRSTSLLQWSACTPSGGAASPVISLLCRIDSPDSGWLFLPDSSATITVSASVFAGVPIIFRKHARYVRPGRFLGAFPSRPVHASIGRALRL